MTLLILKKYPIVDNDRPKVCADRIDGVILTGIGWTKNISKEDIKKVVQDMHIYINEYSEEEIGFKSLNIAKKVLEVSKSIDIYCHSKEDNYMMELLSQITKLAIDKNYIRYDELYTYNEEELFNIFKESNDKELNLLIWQFENIKKEEIPNIELPKVKTRDLKPIINRTRIE